MVVTTDGCWTDRLAVHTVYMNRVVGRDDDGQEVDLKYDFLDGPTEEKYARYERERTEAATRDEGMKLCEREKEALAHMHAQYLLRR